MSDEYDTTEKVERTDTGYRLTVESTRGTGTRDQDKVSVTGKFETLDALDSERLALNNIVAQTMDERREHQPDEGDGDE